MVKQRAQSRGLLWATVGGAVLAAAIGVGVIVAVTSQGGGTAQPTSSSPPPPAAGPTSSTSPAAEAVDAAVSEGGWGPEPNTADPASYWSRAEERRVEEKG